MWKKVKQNCRQCLMSLFTLFSDIDAKGFIYNIVIFLPLYILKSVLISILIDYTLETFSPNYFRFLKTFR